MSFLQTDVQLMPKRPYSVPSVELHLPNAQASKVVVHALNSLVSSTRSSFFLVISLLPCFHLDTHFGSSNKAVF